MIVGPSVTECTAVGRSRNQRTVPKELSLTSRKVLAAVSRRENHRNATASTDDRLER